MIAKPKLILADGTLLEESDCGYFDHELHCWIRKMDMTGAFLMFSDSERTKTIHYLYLGTEEVYDGFTQIVLVRQMEDYVEIRLKGGHRRAA